MQWIYSYEHLEEYLRNWNQWGGKHGPYDPNGMLGLLIACLDNLRTNSLESELETYVDNETFSDEQLAFLNKLLELAKRPPEFQ